MSGEDFFKKSTHLWLGNVLVAVFGIIVFYLLTTILGPENYGNYAIVLAIVAFLALMFYGIVGEAIIRFAKEGKENAFYHGLKLEFYFGLILFLALFFFADTIAGIYSKPISMAIRIVSFVFLLTPFIEAVKAVSIGKKEVKIFVLVSVSLMVSMIFALLVLFVFSRTILFAAIAFLLSNFVTFLMVLRYIDFKLLFKRRKKNRIIIRMNKYIKEGFIYGLTKNFYIQSPLIVGAYFIHSTEIAFFAFGISLATQGIFTFITSIQSVLLPYILDLKNKLQISKYVSVAIKASVVVTILLAAGVLVIIWLLLPILFPQYVDAFKYFPWIFLAYIFLNLRAVWNIFKVEERMDLLTKIAVITAIFSVVLGVILSYFFGLVGMIITLNINVLFFCYLHIFYLRKISDIKLNLLPSKGDGKLIAKYFKVILSSFKR